MSSLLAVTPDVTIRSVAVSELDNNVYLLTSAGSGRQVLIDPADDPEAITRLFDSARADGPEPAVGLIVVTHSHWDHLRALAQVAGSTGAPVLAGAADAAAIERQTGVRVERGLEDGDRVGVPGLGLGVIGLRGHTPGSIALVYEEAGQPTHIFSGDSLFPGGVGNTDRDPARFGQLLADVTARVFNLYNDDAIVHPGHGDQTTLGAERPALEEWRQRGW
ncbi:MAG: MBL fold metallo-hydrolase [Bifidobacteriaceae bacterium]|jgi:glyoxylase-like metal-dependent hydrolase (beta-lactamase superfamily II)|nr:MBL fold metallo-hydrolase [Bifidobacteriaceae bacterium]